MAVFWHQLTPPTCPATGATLTRAQAIDAALTYTAYQITDQRTASSTLGLLAPTNPDDITPAMITIAQPDCCTVAWDLTRQLRRNLSNRASPAFVDRLHTFVRVEITQAEALPAMVGSMMLYVPVTACGQAETVVRSGDGWVRWRER